MTKYDDHMIRAATLRTNGNYVKARMHEEHAQYNYGFGMKFPDIKTLFTRQSKVSKNKASLPQPNIPEPNIPEPNIPEANIQEPNFKEKQKELDRQRINQEFSELQTEILKEISEFIREHCPSMTEPFLPLDIVNEMQQKEFAHINRAKAYFLLKTGDENVLRNMGMNIYVQRVEKTEQTKVKIEFLSTPDKFLPRFYHLLKPQLKQYLVRTTPSTSSQNPSTLRLIFEKISEPVRGHG